MDNTLNGPVDVLAVLDAEIACKRIAVANGYSSEEVLNETEETRAAVAELIEALHTRRMEIGRRGGNTLMSPLRAEWEFLGEVLARIGGAK